MKKFYVFAVALVAALTCGVARAQVLLDYDFAGGEATDVVFYDRDGLTPSFFMRSLGFRVDKPWIALRDDNSSSNYFYGSTSQYSPAGQADDWMVMPAVTVDGPGYILRWESQAYDPAARDGLKVFVSTQGPDPSLFPATPVWEVEEEDAGATQNFEGEFVEHVISLDDFAGETIYIAFVNQSYDKSIIAINSIWAGRRLLVEVDDVQRVTDADSYSPTGTITNESGVTVTDITLQLQYGGTVVEETLTGVNLATGSSCDFAMQHGIALELNEPVDYTLTVTAAGLEPMVYASQVVKTYRQCVVVEDHTGLWCGNCPAGSWAIEVLKEKYPGGVAPIAVHNASSLAISAYDDGLSAKGLTSFPSGWINRTYISTPWGSSQYNFDAPDSWVSLVDSCMAQLPQAGVSVTGYLSDDKTLIWADARIESATDRTNAAWRVILVLTEDSLTGYYQSNYFSGLSTYVGGWESLPPSAGVPLHDVARGIYPSFAGAPGSLPATLEARREYTYAYTIDVPDGLQDTGKLNLIAMVVDGTTDRVINAAIAPVVNAPAAVGGIESDADLRVRTTCGQVVVDATAGTHIAARLYAIDGTLLATDVARGTATLVTGAYRGVAILQATIDGTQHVAKVVVR